MAISSSLAFVLRYGILYPSIERYIPQLSDIFSLWTLRARIRCGCSNYDLYLIAVCVLHNFNQTKSDVSRPQFERSLLRSCGNHLERRSEKMRGERTAKAMKIKIIDSHIKRYHIFHIRPHFEIPMNRCIRSRAESISLNWGIPRYFFQKLWCLRSCVQVGCWIPESDTPTNRTSSYWGDLLTIFQQYWGDLLVARGQRVATPLWN